MPQEEAEIAAANKKKGGILADGKVLPKEDTEVYSTGQFGHLGKAGTKHIVHRVLVEKLVASGQVTLDPPADAEGSNESTEVLTEDEYKQLWSDLGKKPNKAEVAEAIKKKQIEEL